METISVRLGAGRIVEARLGEHTIVTDQPVADGGGSSAPSPFDLFLASIATCSGSSVLDFCRTRDIPFEGITLEMRTTRDPESHMITRVEIEITLPREFPEKYDKAVIRAAQLCSVKRHVEHGPVFETRVLRA